MYHVRLPDQIQLNGLRSALSTRRVDPENNYPPVGQAPAVEAVRFHGELDILSHYHQNFEQNNPNAFYVYDTQYHAHQNQEMQRNMLGDIWLNQGPPTPSFGQGDLTNWAINYLCGPPADPATMAMAATTGDEDFPKPCHHLGPRTPTALPQSNRLVQSEESSASSTQAGETAFSCRLDGCRPFMSLGASASGLAVQAMTPQMSTVTPYVGFANDDGGSSAGASVCVPLPAPRPTHETKERAWRADFTSDRSDVGMYHRSPHRALGSDKTHRRVPNRRTTVARSRSGAARDPVVQYEEDVHVLAERLLNEGADHHAVDLLCHQIFNSGVSAKALTVKSTFQEPSTGISSMRSKYRLLLGDVERVDGSKSYCCLLCPQGDQKEYKNPQDSIRHFLKAHFGIASACTGGCPRLFYRQSEMNQHLKTCQTNLDGRSASDVETQ